jgi:hypothetical protein
MIQVKGFARISGSLARDNVAAAPGSDRRSPQKSIQAGGKQLVIDDKFERLMPNAYCRG